MYENIAGKPWFVQSLRLLGTGAAAALVAVGILALFRAETKALPQWGRYLSYRVAASTTGSAIVAESFLFLVSRELGLLGLVFVPFHARFWVQFWRRRACENLDLGSLGFFQALLGFLRAGMAVPAALSRACAAAPGGFSEWLVWRLSRREQAETVSQALSRVGQVVGESSEAAACLRVLAQLYQSGLPVVSCLERQVRWMVKTAAHRRRVRAMQYSLWTQALIGGGLPWGVFLFSGWMLEDNGRAAELWASPIWRGGLLLCAVLQLSGCWLLGRLGRYA